MAVAPRKSRFGDTLGAAPVTAPDAVVPIGAAAAAGAPVASAASSVKKSRFGDTLGAAPAAPAAATMTADGQPIIADTSPAAGLAIPGTTTQTEIDQKAAADAEAARPGSGNLENAAAGINRGLISLMSAPGWIYQNAANAGAAMQAANAGENVDAAVPFKNPDGGRDIIAGLLEKVGITDPDKVKAKSLSEKLFAAFGEGATMAGAPEMVVPKLMTIARDAGIVGEDAVRLVQGIVGEGQAGRSMVANAAVSGTAQAGGEVAAEAAPDQYKALARAAGSIGAGGLGALATGIPRAVSAGVDVVKRAAEPMTTAGRESMAGRTLTESSGDAGAVRDTLREHLAQPADVPGADLTTAQVAGDMPLLAAERAAATKDPAAFNERRSMQNAARVSAVDAVKPAGQVERTVAAVRDRVKAIDDAADNSVTATADNAAQRSEAVGQGAEPDVAGEQIRGQIEAGRAAEKQIENPLWAAIDPEKKLNMPVKAGPAEAERLNANRSQYEEPMDAQEQGIFDAVSGLPGVVKFSDFTALQKRITTAMKEERMTKGESPKWGRLSQLNQALHRDLDAVIEHQAANDPDLFGRVDAVPATVSRETPAAAAPGAPPAAAPTVTGNAFTPSGQKVPVKYEVVEASSLQASHNPDMTENPNFNKLLQPRNRDRAASELQVRDIAAKLEPERLGPSASTAEGAPIVGPDNMVESGNGRTLGIRQAYAQGGEKATAYRRYLEAQGYNLDGIKEPVLIRRREGAMSPAERIRFAQDAGKSPTMSTSASEDAAVDSSRLTAETLSQYRGGDVASAENRDFVRAFVGKVAGEGEANALTTADGALSVTGAQRVRNALLHSAYGDAPLVEALADAGDENIQSFGKALYGVSGEVAQLKAAIKAGEVDAGADMSGSLVDAAKFVQDARKRGVTLANAVAQLDAFDALSADALKVLQYAYGDGLAGRINRDRFESIVKMAVTEAKAQTTEARLFGEPAKSGEILQAAGEQYARKEGTSGGTAVGNVFDGQGGGKGGAQGVEPVARKTGPGSDGAGGKGQAGEVSDSTKSAPGDKSKSILPKEPPPPPLEANMGPEDAGRLRAAKAVSKKRIETFDNKTLGPIRKRPFGGETPYDMLSGAVPGKLFFGGPKSRDAIRVFKKAVGEDQATSSLELYAVDRLRRSALGPDGITLDAGRLATWRRTHSDALKELPALAGKLDDAESASRAIGDVTAAAKAAKNDARIGAVGKLLEADDPEEATRLIGKVFGKPDSAKEMARIRRMTAGDPEALDGLHRAIIEHINSKFVSNAESGVSGVGTMKADQFQTFVRENEKTLVAAGFSTEQIAVLKKVAENLRKANRSIVAIKLPGSPGTAQDLHAIGHGDGIQSMFFKLAMVLGAEHTVTTLSHNAFLGIPTVIGVAVANGLRQQGIKKVDDLVRDALLDPALALRLMEKVKPAGTKKAMASLLERWGRASILGAVNGDES